MTRVRYVVTKREALRMLGVRQSLLSQLERWAGLPDLDERDGYTDSELKKLVRQMRLILGR